MTAAKQLFITHIIWGAALSVVVGFGAAAAAGAVAFMLVGDSGSISASQIGFVYGPGAAFIVGALAALIVAVRHAFGQYKQPVPDDQVPRIRMRFWLSVVLMVLCIIVGTYYYYVRLSAPSGSSGICQVDSKGSCLPEQISPAN